MKRIVCFGLFVLVLALVSCSESSKLVGTWETDDGYMSFTFNSDGTCISKTKGSSASPGNWLAKDGTITITQISGYGPQPPLKYTLDGKTFAILGYIFHKK